jgi:hypothetical protein
MGLGTLLSDAITGEGRRKEEDRAIDQQNNSLQQQIALIRAAGGPATPAGADAFNRMSQDPNIQKLLQGVQQKTYQPQDFQAKAQPRLVDPEVLAIQRDTARTAQISHLSKAISDYSSNFTTKQIEKGELDKDETLKTMKQSLGQLLMGGDLQRPQQPGQPAQGQPTQDQPTMGQPRTADLFVAQKHDPNAYEPSPGGMTPQAPGSTKAGPRLNLAQKAPMMENWWLSGWKGQGTTGKGPSDGTVEADPLSALADQFVGAQSSRKQAMADGKAVVPNRIDQTDTTPNRMADHGIQDPDLQREFSDLEAMTKGNLPDGIDLRQAYSQNPQSFAKLLAAIKKGVPDNKGGTRKLSMKEIVRAIQGMGY